MFDKNLNRPEDDQIVLDRKSQCIDMGIICVNDNESRMHLGENNNDNFETLKTLFDITQKLILIRKHEIRHVSTIEWHFTLLTK